MSLRAHWDYYIHHLNYWDYVAWAAAGFTVVMALGEWVFHWWDSPGDVLSFLGLFVSVFALGFAASKRDVERLIAHADANFNRMMSVFEAFLEKQDRMLEKQDRMLDQQERTLATLERHTPILEEVVQFFRRPQPQP